VELCFRFCPLDDRIVVAMAQLCAISRLVRDLNSKSFLESLTKRF